MPGIVYLAAVFLLGPLLLVNGVLKDRWSSAWPPQIAEFEGDKRHAPPFVIADQCVHKCSSVSAEASLGLRRGSATARARRPRATI